MVSCIIIKTLLLIFYLIGATSFECGHRKGWINLVIVKGQNAYPKEWPWHAAVYHRQEFNSEKYACGATLISEKFLLTVDHCVWDNTGRALDEAKILVRLGAHNLQVSENVQNADVARVHRYKGSSGAKNDIAILELATEVRFTDYVQPACINQVPDLTGEFGTVVGWGFTETDSLSQTLKKSQMPVIDSIQCLESDRKLFGSSLDRSLFCAGFTNGTTVCNGDSGGGIHFERKGVWYVGGLVSFTVARGSSNLCNTEGYAAFTKVYIYLPWIWNVTKLSSIAPKTNSAMLISGEDPVSSRTYQNYLPGNCGTRVVNRIARGQRADIFEFPWMAVLISDGDFCMGTLISKRYILTTIQCIRNPSPYQVRLGDLDVLHETDCNVNEPTECAPPARIYDIEYIVQHRSYNRETRHNDIALIRLKTEVSFDDHIQPVCLPTTSRLQRMTFTEYTIAGWGMTDPEDNLAPILQKGKVPATECKAKTIERMRFPVDPVSQICSELVTTDGSIPCVGDIGGLLGNTVLYNNVPRFIQYGVTSYGKATCGNGPWIYTNVTHFMPWIRANMEA